MYNCLTSLEEEVTGGDVTVEVKYGIIPVYSITLKLCDVLADVGNKCPVKAGNQTASVTEAIPSEVPSVSPANILKVHV